MNDLLSLPFDRVEIDRSSIRDITTRSEAAAIVRAVTRLGSDLGMRVTADSVETCAQFGRHGLLAKWDGVPA